MALKEEVKSQGLTWFEYDDLESFGSQVRDKLWQRIQAQIGQGPTVERDWLKIERDFHHIFATDRTRRFVGRRAYLDRMQVFCEGEGSGGSLLVVKGMPGCGKTALMARFSEEMQRRHPDWLIVPHFVGASPRSTNLRRTLRRFHGEMNRYAGLEEEIPEDIRDLHNRFSEKLQKASEKDRVLFVLDAVNQMEHSDNPQEMTWLPFNLPKNVCFVISSLEGESLDALQARRPWRSRPEVLIPGRSSRWWTSFWPMYARASPTRKHAMPSWPNCSMVARSTSRWPWRNCGSSEFLRSSVGA